MPPTDTPLGPGAENVLQIGTLVLLGVAFGEMAGAVRAGLDEQGLTSGVVCLFVIFFTVAIRFTIGNYEGFRRGLRVETHWFWWAVHFSVTSLSSVLLVFLGGQANVDLLGSAKFGFFPLLISLYALDGAWLLGSYPRRRKQDPGAGRAPVWTWIGFDAVLLALIAGCRIAFGHEWVTRSLIVLAAAHGVVFLLDLRLLFRLSRGEPDPTRRSDFH